MKLFTDIDLIISINFSFLSYGLFIFQRNTGKFDREITHVEIMDAPFMCPGLSAVLSLSPSLSRYGSVPSDYRYYLRKIFVALNVLIM